MIDAQLLKRLVCPENHQPLAVAPSDLVSRANAALARGALKNCAGRAVTAHLDGGLLREDGQILYAISAGIPILLVDEGIPTAQLGM